ncbi:MAG: ABC transporter permease [bacterium]|jgi:spermidine/putrescine transport system permease protein
MSRPPRLSGQQADPAVWLLPISGWMLLFYVVPAVYIFLASFMTMENYRLVPAWTLSNYRYILSQAMYHKAYLNSLWLAGKTVVLTTLLAYPLAYALAFAVPKRWRLPLLVAVIAPFWTNYLVRAYSWQIILANKGLLNYLLALLGLVREPVNILYTPQATTIGLVHYLLAIMTLNLYTTLENIDRRLLEAAKDLGANGFQVFRQVILPLSSGGLVSGAMFIFILAYSDFVSPSVLGGQIQRVFPQLVADAIQWNIDWPMASAFAVIMVTTILLVLSVLSRWMKTGSRVEGGWSK